MISFLKVKVLERQGMSREKALETVLEETMKANQQMDFKLAECMNYLKPEDFEKVFPRDVYGPPEKYYPEALLDLLKEDNITVDEFKIIMDSTPGITIPDGQTTDSMLKQLVDRGLITITNNRIKKCSKKKYPAQRISLWRSKDRKEYTLVKGKDRLKFGDGTEDTHCEERVALILADDFEDMINYFKDIGNIDKSWFGKEG